MCIRDRRRELEKVNRKFSALYGDYSEHLINESEYLTLKQQYLCLLYTSVGLKEKEVQFIRNMGLNAVDNMKLLTE